MTRATKRGMADRISPAGCQFDIPVAECPPLNWKAGCRRVARNFNGEDKHQPSLNI